MTDDHQRTPLGPGPLVYAHRGDSSRAADNTTESFMLAVEAGADGIEFDVRRTLDGVIVVHHDEVVQSLGVISKISYSTLRERAPHILTFREAVGAIPRNVFVNVEIKNFPYETSFDEDRTIVDVVLNEISEHDDSSRILLSSFDTLSMQRAGEVSQDILRGQLTRGPQPLDVGIELATELGLDALHIQYAQIGDDPVGHLTEAGERGLRVAVWDVNTTQEVAAATEAGADILIADDPGMVRKYIDQM